MRRVVTIPSRRQPWCAMAILALVTVSAPAAEPPAPPEQDKPKEQEKTRLAVLDFKPGDQVTASDGIALADAVRSECQNAGKFDLMDREMMKERMDEKDWAVIGECDQVKCLVKFGKSLDVQKMIGGFAAKLGDAWVLTIRLVDVNTGRQEGHFSRKLSGGKADLWDLAGSGARELLGLAPEVSRPKGETPPPVGDKVMTLDLGGGVKMDLVRIEAGSFQMGSVDGEKPVHAVRISKPFYMGKAEVTQAQWKAVMGDNPSYFKGDDLPVEQVTWDDAQEFCRKLSLKARREVRLPTEAEWEYACRAGGTGKWTFGDREFDLQDYAWYSDNSEAKTHPVGLRKPNAWGLYDVHGNVWEWCADRYGSYSANEAKDPIGLASGEARVLRGGSWYNYPHYCRSARRDWSAAGSRGYASGLRVVGSSGTTP